MCTQITPDGGTSTILLHRGVKQTDPLSPLLLNAVLEPLLLALEGLIGHNINEGCAVSSLAFADDLVLLAETPEQAKNQQLAAEKYEGHLESKERFAIQRYLLIIGKKKNMQVLWHTFT